jgi:hypothetical protein
VSIIYSRPLLDQEAIEQFLSTCLGIKGHLECTSGETFTVSYIAKKVRDAESAVGQTNRDQTLGSQRNRVKDYRDDDKREALRETILTELATFDRLDNDDEIRLGIGGAKPIGKEPEANSKAFFVIGLPASGKSTLVNAISDELGALILDSDFAKRKLPEFDNTPAGANIVHKESSEIVFGGVSARPSLFGYCQERRFNIVVPTIGQDYEDLRNKRDTFIAAGYEVHLTTTLLARHIATARALERFLSTSRYVPLGLIFDGYANDPLMNYYRARTEMTNGTDSGWASLGAISTVGRPPTVVDVSSEQSPVNFLKDSI